VTEQSFSNAYGHFADAGRAYIITNPATPMPWCNVICNGRYGLVVSQNGGGFSWHDDAQHNVLTRWEMDLVRDCYGKFLYVMDRGDGRVWSVAPAPCQAPIDSYRCTHEPGATTFETATHGIAAKWSLCVDAADGVEVWGVELTNTGAMPRKLRVSSYFEWTCGVAPDAKREFHRLFFTTKHDAGRRAIIATKNMWDIPNKTEKDHWNIDWPYAAAHSVTCGAFERTLAVADKSTFLGRYGSTACPRAMTRSFDKGWDVSSGGFGRFGDACAALGGDLTIAPGQTVKLHYTIAVASDEKQVLALVDKFAGADAPRRTLDGARAAWSQRLSATRVRTQATDFDILNNTWLPYQAISGRLWGRTGYYQQSGAFGFRDQLQDSQVWLPIEPTRCADQIMLHATRQFVDGSVNHWWHALADFGNHTACSDDYLWLAFVTANYLKETGDFAILQRTSPFRDSPQATTLLDHCSRAIERSFQRLSPRGLPLIGSCDWNDGLSALGLEGKGESVWLAMFLCQILADWNIIYTRAGGAMLAKQCLTRRDALIAAINTHAWDDGQVAGSRGHYRCATKDSGDWVGASHSSEGKIHLNPQTWSILADTGPADRKASAWDAAKKNLLTPYGPLLLAPAYTVPDRDIGYITRYSPGSRENGGVYMHAATWALAAACAMRDRAAVESIWQSIAPPNRAADPEAYWAEPYVLPGNVDGPLSDKPGRAGWTWYTGSAAWLRRVSLEWVLGVRPVWAADGSGEALLIDPVPPARLGRVSFERPWRKYRVLVEFDAATWKAGPAHVELEGRGVPGGILTDGMLAAAGAAARPARVVVSWK
jgi:cellobiose phosphorylase